jgi:PAS domain S-box-containing protein
MLKKFVPKKPKPRPLVLPFAIRPEAVLEAIPEIIMIVDENKVYRWTNQAGLDFFGDDVIGKEASYYFADESRASETMRILFESKESVVRRENWQRRKDGEKRLLFWNNRILKNASGHYMGAISTARDMTERRLREDYREISREILGQLNQPGEWEDLLNNIVDTLKYRTGFAAIGLRLRKGNDFPYCVQKGFSKQFLATENTLQEGVGSDDAPNTHACNDCLACTCGLVISGKADLSSPSFTRGGSFWTNDSLALLEPSAEQLPRYHPRNLCMQYGYASLALIPIRNKDGIVGLLQLADSRKGRFTLETIELLESVGLHIGESLMRRQAEAALETERAQLRTLIDNLPCGVFFKDTESRFVVTNKSLVESVGEATLEAMIGRDDTAYHPAELARQFREEELQIMREGVGQYGKEEWIRLGNIPDFHCLATTKVPIRNKEGAIIGLVGFCMDITDQKQAEATLDKERLQLRTLIDNLPYAVYIKDTDGRFELANKSLAHFMGVATPEELIGRTDLEHHPEALAHQFMEDELRIMRDGIGIYGKEHPVKIAGSDELQYWSTTKVPLKDATGRVIGLVGIGIDITEQKAAQKAILDMAEAKSKFTSTVSHELRSPLAMIKEATSLVLEGVLGSLNDGQKEMLEITKSNVDRLGRMINNVLEFQKMGAGKTTYDLTKNKINDLVKEVTKGAVLFAGERKNDLSLDLQADLPEVVFDRDKITQVLINLLANAIKYSDSGPVVTKTRFKNNEVQISVQDYGQGIAPTETEHIFKPFSQGKSRKKGGTGLGLAIVKEIILAHHGRIWVESEPGKGSTFTFTLPA